MENKRTAVDYLKEKFITIHWFLVRDEISRAQADEMLKKSFEQAKEMEKEQHKLTWERGSYSLLDHGSGEDFEDYYNETYANDTTKGLPKENSKRRGWHY